MAWGAKGKYWNVGLSEPGRQAATNKQLWTLHLLSGRKIDYRGKGLTRDQASELITKLRQERSEASQTSIMRDAMFEAVYRKALSAADKAGDQWFEEHPEPVFRIHDPQSGISIGVHDRIGDVFIVWPKDTVFGRWLRQNARNGQYDYVYLPHKYFGRPEFGLQKATTEAAKEVLSDVAPGLKIRSQDLWT